MIAILRPIIPWLVATGALAVAVLLPASPFPDPAQPKGFTEYVQKGINSENYQAYQNKEPSDVKSIHRGAVAQGQQGAANDKNSGTDSPQKKDDDSVKWTDVWIARLTVILAAVAVAQLIAAAVQAIWTRASVNVAHASAIQAERAANAAHFAVDISTSTASTQLRAYLCIAECNLTIFDVGQKPAIKIRITNAGQTPAYRMVAIAGCAVVPEPHDGKPPPLPQHTDQSSQSIIGPGLQTFVLCFVEKTLTGQTKNNIVTGANGIHLVVRVDYLDIFGKPHFTTANCFYGGKYKAYETGSFTNLPTGNEAD